MKLTALFIFFGMLDVALSCSCLAQDLSSEEVIKEIFCQVETVAVVYVDKVEKPTERYGDTTYTVRLTNIFKGPEGKKKNDVYIFRSPPRGMCGIELEENEKYLVAITNSGGKPSLRTCNQFVTEGKPELKRIPLDLRKKLRKLRKHKCQ